MTKRKPTKPKLEPFAATWNMERGRRGEIGLILGQKYRPLSEREARNLASDLKAFADKAYGSADEALADERCNR